MVILPSNYSEIMVKFPKSVHTNATNLKLTIKSLVMNLEQTFDVVDTLSERDFYTIKFNTQLLDGEYEYHLHTDGVDEYGLLYVGDYKVKRDNTNMQLDKELNTVTYIQYGE